MCMIVLKSVFLVMCIIVCVVVLGDLCQVRCARPSMDAIPTLNEFTLLFLKNISMTDGN